MPSRNNYRKEGSIWLTISEFLISQKTWWSSLWHGGQEGEREIQGGDRTRKSPQKHVSSDLLPIDSPPPPKIPTASQNSSTIVEPSLQHMSLGGHSILIPQHKEQRGHLCRATILLAIESSRPQPMAPQYTHYRLWTMGSVP